MDDEIMIKNFSKEVIDLYGIKFIVHKNYGKKDHKNFELRGIINPISNPKFSYFDFLGGNDLEVGDILQKEGLRDLWEVVDIEEKIGFFQCKAKKSIKYNED
ncbi:MAG: hypothetical protein MUF15_20635 [Acidobacteria bacterium]|jgi:hypothetical protein|nr:hypothetical protein [Acidobacteriota bacterium]